MRVFSVEMLVKEEGAAVVEAAMKRLKKETQSVAEEMKKTTQSVTSTGRALKDAGSQTTVAGDKAAKAAIGFAAVGQSLASTGKITADVGTKIIEAGGQVAMMFGPKGLAVAALLAFATAAITSFNKASDEAQKMEEDFKKSLSNIVNQGDIIALTKQLRDLELGVPSGALDEIVDVSDGILAMRNRIKELQETGFTAFNKANRTELNNLTTALRTAESQALALRKAILNASRPLGEPTAAPITITAPAPAPAGGRGAEPPRVTPRALPSAMTVPMTPVTVVEPPPIDLKAIAAQIPIASNKFYTDAEVAAIELARNIRDTFQQNIGGALVGGIVGGIEQAVASGNIGEGFKALSSMLLAGIGDAMIKFGTSTAAFSQFMGKITAALATLNPAAGLALSLALIGTGAALKGAARGMFGGQGGGAAGSIASFGGFGGGMGGSLPTTQIIFGQTSATTAAGMQARQAMNVTIIGPNDPQAQRSIQELMSKAESRGRLG